MDEREPARKDEAGKDLIRAILGKGHDCRRYGSLTLRAGVWQHLLERVRERDITLADFVRLKRGNPLDCSAHLINSSQLPCISTNHPTSTLP